MTVTQATFDCMSTLPTATLAYLARSLASQAGEVNARLAAAAQQILQERATVAAAA